MTFGPAINDPAYAVAAIKAGDVFVAGRVRLRNIAYPDIERAITDHRRAPSEEVRSPKPITDILDLAACTLGHDVTPKTACDGKRTRVAQNMRDICRRFYEVKDFDVSQAKLPADIQADEALADYEIAVGDGFIHRSAPVFRMRFCVICHVPG